jgi:hypothetical protein
VDIDPVRDLVAEQEFDRAELMRLESRRGSEHVAKLGVLRGREGLEHRPLLEELALDLLHARQDLEARREAVGLDVHDRGGELMDHELHPQLARLVLDDE